MANAIKTKAKTTVNTPAKTIRPVVRFVLKGQQIIAERAAGTPIKPTNSKKLSILKLGELWLEVP